MMMYSVYRAGGFAGLPRLPFGIEADRAGVFEKRLITKLDEIGEPGPIGLRTGPSLAVQANGFERGKDPVANVSEPD